MTTRALSFVMVFTMGLSTPLLAQPRTEISTFMHQLAIDRPTGRTEVSQWVTPLLVHLPIAGGKIEMHTAGMYLRQTSQNPQSIVGTLDSQINGRWPLGRHVLLSAFSVLPTGKGPLDAQDEALIRTISRNDLNFPVKTFGQGLRTGGALSLVHQAGKWTMSAGGGFTYRGAYEPIEGVIDYDPGDEITGSVGVDYTHKSWVLRTTLAGTFHRTDRQNGVAVFRNAKQILLQFGVHYTGRTFRLKAEAYEIVRLKNKDLTNGAFLYETRDSNGNDIRIRTEASWSPLSFLTLYGVGSFKHITHNAYAPGTALYQGDAHLYEGGGGFALSLDKDHHLSVRMTRISGRAEDDTAEISARNIRGALSVLF